MRLGSAYAENKQYEQARGIFNKLLRLNTCEDKAYNQLGRVFA